MKVTKTAGVTLDRRFLDAFRVIRPRSVSVGYCGLDLSPLRDLPSAQLGYAIDSDQVSLVGEADGDWRASWQVIGTEQLAGDPIFVDLARPGWPVFTAVHGQGRWDRRRIALSLEGFAHAMQIVQVASRR